MELPIAANFVERSSGSLVEASIRLANEDAMAGWLRWIYRVGDEDRRWDWLSIYQESQSPSSALECYAAWTKADLQGLMSLDIRQRTSPEGEVIAVEYLSTNPVNRANQRGLKNVGTVLIAVAVLRSQELGLHGRLVLDALPGAETFYENLGMTRQPGLSPEGFAQFILSSHSATELLEEIKKKQILVL